MIDKCIETTLGRYLSLLDGFIKIRDFITDWYNIYIDNLEGKKMLIFFLNSIYLEVNYLFRIFKELKKMKYNLFSEKIIN